MYLTEFQYVKKIDYTIRDTQSSIVDPLSSKEFDVKAYKEYDDELDIKCEKNLSGESGVLVYRRMRVAKCFSYGCKILRLLCLIS